MAIRANEAADVGESAEQLMRLVPTLGQLPSRILAKVSCHISIDHVPAKAVLIMEGRHSPWQYILFRGLLQQFTVRQSNETTLTILAKPAIVHPHAFLRARPPLASVRTLRPSCIGRVSTLQISRLIEQEREFAEAVITDAVAELHNTVLELKYSRTQKAFERLVAWIVAMLEGAQRQVTLPYNKTVLASRLGITPPTLSREFARLAHHGVTVHRRALTVDDPDRLRRLMNVEPPPGTPVP